MISQYKPQMSNRDIPKMSLKAEKIYLYYCDLTRSEHTNQALCSYLNTEDQDRFNAYTNTARKRQFGMARWLIKQVLKRHFGLAESHTYQLHNYTQWIVTAESKSFAVSISHSGVYVAVVVTESDVRLGVDVEKHKIRNYSELLEGFATLAERQLITNSSAQKNNFYRLWTAKEALLKATQKTLLDIAKVDLSACFSLADGKVANHHYFFSFIGHDSYSLSLMSNRPFSLEQQELLTGIS